MTHLQPTSPPGRVTRKARGFAADIVRLRLQGYTLDAIRQALANAGIQVSICTVWRESKRVDALAVAARQPVRDASRAHFEDQQTSATAAARSPSLLPSPANAAPPVLVPYSGKEFADRFMSTRITNPLFRSKE